jgi:hypothetical protein
MGGVVVRLSGRLEWCSMSYGSSGKKISSVPVGYDSEGNEIRVRRRKRDYDVIDTLLYPITDGPGVALLVFLPPVLSVMTIPVMDIFTEITSKNALNPIHLLLLPIALPLVIVFGMLVGYIGLFYGRVLAASAYGEDDHPRWPDWDIHEVSEGLGRWIWATVMGLIIGGFPAMAYWINCGDVDIVDQFVFADLAGIGTAYALMGLAASLLHENILSANPLAILVAIRRVGWDYVGPCVLCGLGIISGIVAWRFVLFQAPNLFVGAVGLWLCWVWALYQGMVIFRVLGLTYHKHTDTLGWFRRPPRWRA